MRLGIPELLVILAIVILIFGASRLPELGKGIGKGIKNFKDATKDGDSSEKRGVACSPRGLTFRPPALRPPS